MTDYAYLRVSLATAESGTIAKQRAQLAAHAAQGHVEYVDESVSGSKIPFADRPAGGRLLADLRAGDRVLVTRIDRAARNVRDLLDLVERIEKAGASVVFTEQHIDTAGAMGRFLLVILAGLAELEAGIISERRIETLAVMKGEGRHAAGGIPVGLRSVPRGTGGRELAVDPDKGPLVADVVARILDGATVASQAPRLGVTASSLSRLLGNRLLAEHGVITWTQYDALRARTPGRKTWTSTGGIGEALSCYACEGRLYLAKASGGKAEVYKCGPGRHSGGQTRGVTITATKLHAEVEAAFLAGYGDLEVIEERTLGDDEERAARVHAARSALEAATAALTDAEGETAEDQAYAALRAAKGDLRLADSMPVQTRMIMQPTGETYAERWADAADDDAARVRLLQACGAWVVWPPDVLETGGRVEHEPDPSPVLVDPWAAPER